MDDIYVNGYQVNRDGPILVKGLPVHPLCKDKRCKELLSEGEEVLLRQADEKYHEVIGHHG